MILLTKHPVNWITYFFIRHFSITWRRMYQLVFSRTWFLQNVNKGHGKKACIICEFGKWCATKKKKIGRLTFWGFNILTNIATFRGDFGMMSFPITFDLELPFSEHPMGLMCRRSPLGKVGAETVVSKRGLQIPIWVPSYDSFYTMVFWFIDFAEEIKYR